MNSTTQQCAPTGLAAIPTTSDSSSITNLVQANNAVTTTPTSVLMQIVSGNNEQNPYKIPAYLAQSELLTRKQMSAIAQQAQTGATGMQQAPAQVNPAQAPQQVNPTAPQQMVNPQQGLMALPPKAPANGIASVPMSMFNSKSYAGGGIVAFANNENQPVSVNMPDSDAGEKEAQDRYGAKQNPAPLTFFGYDVSNPPAEIPKDQRILRQIVNDIASGNLAPPPPNFVPKSSTVAPAVIPSSPQPLPSQPVEEPAQPITSANVPVNAPVQRPEGVTDTGINVGTTRPTPPTGIATIPNRVAPANAPVMPSSAPVAPVSAPAGLPSVAKPMTDPFAVQTPEEAFAERRKLQEMAGVSKDPYAAVIQRQAAMEARDQAKYAQDPVDRLLNQLSAISAADPTKGAGYALGVSAKANQEMKDKQTEYRDKKEQLGLEFQTNIAKEQDARARGDVKGVEDAIAAQKKNKIDLAKVDVDRLGHELSYKASMASTGNAAARLQAELPLLQAQADAEINKGKLYGAQADKEKAGIESRSAKEKRLSEEGVSTRINEALKRLESDPFYKVWDKYLDPLTGTYKAGTPAGQAILKYQQDVKEEVVRAARKDEPPMLPAPPVAVQNIIEKGNLLSKDKIENTLSYGQPTQSVTPPPKPAAYPDAKLGKDPQGNPAWYIQKDGQYYKVK